MNFLEKSLDKQNQFWKYIVVFIGAFIAGQVIGGIPLYIIIFSKIISSGEMPANIMDFAWYGLSKNTSLILMMIPFVFTLAFAILFIKGLHKRTFAEIINGTKKIRINRCLTGFLVWGTLYSIYLAVDYFIYSENFVLQFNASAFIPLLLISLIFIPIQTTSEEFLFRGYLTQGVAGWTKNRWLALIIPSILFGLMHFWNPEVKEYGFWLSMPQYILFGLFFGLVSILDDGIELAMGVHAANNLFASLFVTSGASALQTDAVFTQLYVIPEKEIAALIIVGTVATIYFAKKYKWDFNVLNKKVVLPEQPLEDIN